MTALLVTLTVVEIALAVGVLAVYLLLIDRRLRVISSYLGKVAFGVRAVDTQTASIGPSVVQINTTLREIDAALGPIADKASRAGTATRDDRSPAAPPAPAPDDRSGAPPVPAPAPGSGWRPAV